MAIHTSVLTVPILERHNSNPSDCAARETAQIYRMTQRSRLLVTGASGHLGRRVLELLLASGTPASHLIALTRAPDRLAELAARGVEVRAASFDVASSLGAAFRGAERALIISTDAIDVPGRRIAQHRAAVHAAREAGVLHVVYTSLTNPGPESLVSIAPDHHATEVAIADVFPSHTVLRNNLYTDYLLGSLPHAVRAGRIANSIGDGAVGYVTREDCARAAAAALASDFEGRAVHDITGPAAVTQGELAAIVSELSGRRVTYEALGAEAAQRGLVQAGLPEPIAALLVSFERSGAHGQLAVASSAVSLLTGAPPVSVRDFLARHRAVLLG
jgi:NAD(P)H dehydrogenase (quinone)